jgi:prefoldin subunit 5
MTNTEITPDKQKIQQLVVAKQEISAKIKDLRAQMQRLNIDLAKAGATIETISCW